MPKAPRASVNPVLIPGVNRFGSTKSARLAGRSQRKYAAKPAAAPEAKKVVGYYPADDAKSPIPSAARNRSQRITKLRDSIKPGQVLILLAGRFKGHRVVFLKQLPSGLLLVTGPFKVNGVPLRRVNQRMVIATSTRLDVSKVAADKIDDALFARSDNASAKKYAGKPFLAADSEEAHVLPAEFKTTQAAVDAAIAPQLKAEPLLKAYLGARFSLTKDLVPHLIKF